MTTHSKKAPIDLLKPVLFECRQYESAAAIRTSHTTLKPSENPESMRTSKEPKKVMELSW